MTDTDKSEREVMIQPSGKGLGESVYPADLNRPALQQDINREAHIADQEKSLVTPAKLPIREQQQLKADLDALYQQYSQVRGYDNMLNFVRRLDEGKYVALMTRVTMEPKGGQADILVQAWGRLHPSKTGGTGPVPNVEPPKQS